jgi:hypothetical protein
MKTFFLSFSLALIAGSSQAQECPKKAATSECAQTKAAQSTAGALKECPLAKQAKAVAAAQGECASNAQGVAAQCECSKT